MAELTGLVTVRVTENLNLPRLQRDPFAYLYLSLSQTSVENWTRCSFPCSILLLAHFVPRTRRFPIRLDSPRFIELLNRAIWPVWSKGEDEFYLVQGASWFELKLESAR